MHIAYQKTDENGVRQSWRERGRKQNERKMFWTNGPATIRGCLFRKISELTDRESETIRFLNILKMSKVVEWHTFYSRTLCVLHFDKRAQKSFAQRWMPREKKNILCCFFFPGVNWLLSERHQVFERLQFVHVLLFRFTFVRVPLSFSAVFIHSLWLFFHCCCISLIVFKRVISDVCLNKNKLLVRFSVCAFVVHRITKHFYRES